jgi:hypothetical protein
MKQSKAEAEVFRDFPGAEIKESKMTQDEWFMKTFMTIPKPIEREYENAKDYKASRNY